MNDLDERLSRILHIAASYAADERSRRRALAIDYLLEIGELLNDHIRDPQALSPLADLIPYLAKAENLLPFEERRGLASKPSDALLVRVTATIDLLQESGYSLESAAQHVTRQLMRVGAAPPAEGGDPRGWKRVLIWRDRLLHLRRSHPAWDAYEEFKAEIADLPRQTAMAWATDGKMWDQRERAKIAQ